MKKLISWNVNGIRAIVGKGFLDIFKALDADVFCLQETKVSEGQIYLPLDGYHQYWNYAVKKGYSGTAIFSKEKPLAVTFGLAMEEHDQEGRVICAEYPEWYLVTVYTPNSKDGLLRLPYRMDWEDALQMYLLRLNELKPVIVCGDLNVAHQDIDLENPGTNHMSAGFSDEERGKFGKLLDAGFVDSFRHFYPEETAAYTWWSYRTKARERNAGWRIDYFCVSKALAPKLQSVKIHADVMGSDHCPVEVVLG